MSEAYIVDYVRSPFTFAKKGALANVRPEALGAHVVRALLDKAGVPGDEIEDIVWACAFQEGEQGLNLGRVVGLEAGLPVTTCGMTINRWCGSALQAVQAAAGMLKMGAGDAFVAGGTECTSRVPMMGFNLLPPPGWTQEQVDGYVTVGLSAEIIAKERSISREEQDLFAHNSHRKALSAQREGRFDAEIAPYHTGDGVVDKDGCIKDTSLKKMAMLKPAFLKGGTVTAATASPFTDGSAAVLVCGEDFLKRHDLKPLARIVSFAVSGCEPGKMGLGPIESSRKALKRAGMTIADMGVVEMNEAFSSQAEASRRALDIDPDILNMDGGAIALGHPLGATGARLVGKCATLLHRENKRYGLATQCMGGGMGIAMVLEAA